MKKQIIFSSSSLMLLISNGYSHEKTYSRLSFSGYRVTIVYADAFRVEMSDKKVSYSRIISNNILSFSINDQSGRTPKDEITVYTDKLEYLKLHNSELSMDRIFETEYLEIIIANSFGRININATELSVNLSAESRFVATGRVELFDCIVNSESSLEAERLEADQIAIEVTDNSNLTFNAKTIVKEIVSDSTIKQKNE